MRPDKRRRSCKEHGDVQHNRVLGSLRLDGVEETETDAYTAHDARRRNPIHASTHLHAAVLAASDRRAENIQLAEFGLVVLYYNMMCVAITKETACIALMTDETDILWLFTNAGVHGVSVSERSARR